MAKYIVRYGVMRALGVMAARGKDSFERGSRVIVRTNRGLEVGDVLSEAVEESVKMLKDPYQGQILRGMSSQDANEWHHMQVNEKKEFDICRRYIAKSGLSMQLVDVEHVFGGERIVVYYLADGRVDFRELVKQLAAEFQTRIEMRQIGVRDEAKLLADYGDCGKSVCCNSHLYQMPPVSMKMAKLQKATLDPTKISGRCGRLKCCLRYEHETYEKIQKELPPIGSDVMTEQGQAHVLSHQILTSQLLVQTESNGRMFVDASDVQVVKKKKAKKEKE